MDENIPIAVTKELRRDGYSIVTTSDAGLLGTDDKTQLAYAATHGYIIVTHDTDFFSLAKTNEHSGIIHFRQPCSIGKITTRLKQIASFKTAAEMRNHIEYC